MSNLITELTKHLGTSEFYTKGLATESPQVFDFNDNPLEVDWDLVRASAESKSLLEAWKVERAKAVASITVEVDGMLFDGDEISQTRMARSVSVMDAGETIPWVLSNNVAARVTKEQLKAALRLAGSRQTELWIKQE